MEVTRRTLARMLAATAALPTATVAQTTPADSDEDIKMVREQMRNNAQQLAKVSVPMATEPAFHFKA